jgi:ribonuclease HI
VILTPSQLLLAIAEHETLERTCAAVPGLTQEGARKLLRGAARALLQERLPLAPLPSAPPRAAREAPAKAAGARKKTSAPARDTKHLLFVYSDGAARGNPGPAGAGAVITDAAGRVLARLGRFLGHQTNNVAEYQGLLLGLRHAQELGAREVEVRADSELMIRQLQGRYQVRNPALKPLHAEAMRLLRGFDQVELKHIPREENALADEMSNRAIDEEMG